jgi:hypothetical protein
MSKNQKNLPTVPKVDDMLISQKNWFAAISGEESISLWEYPLYSDINFYGEYINDLEPYSFLNTVPIPNKTIDIMVPIVLRISIHIDFNSLQTYEIASNESMYHGRSLADEIAAIASLCLGSRIRAGGYSRVFNVLDKDPFGRPCSFDDKPKPTLNIDKNRLIIPSIVEPKSLEELKIISSITWLKPTQYLSLIRACNFYQDALWVAESEPNLAWLMLVSSLETAANEFKSSNGTKEERLKESKPNLFKILEESGGKDLISKVATEIEHTLGATKKFIDFTLQFLPDEPEIRPEELFLRIDWSNKSIKSILSKIYAYRSRALHGGIPFPLPMLKHPLIMSSQPSEKPMVSLAMHAQGCTWVPEDVPISLHCFHYIVRGTLLNWWKYMVDENQTTSAETESS